MAIYAMHHNFCKHSCSLRVTPAMESGLTDHVWNLEEVVGFDLLTYAYGAFDLLLKFGIIRRAAAQSLKAFERN